MRLLARIVVIGTLLASCASAEEGNGTATPGKETAVAGARIRGGGVRMDVQVGRGMVRKPGKAGATIVAPNAVVTP